MKYMGSKNRIAKDILPIILKDRKPNQWYVEPFVGGANLIDKVDGNRIGNDVNTYLICLLESLSKGWVPPKNVSEELYNRIKDNISEFDPELVGYIGFQLSFGSKWFGGYRRDSKGIRNYSHEAQRNVLSQSHKLKDIIFYTTNYNQFYIPEQSIIYCDPPYENTVSYKDKFNHTEFWQWCRDMSNKGHTVYVSEYNSPDDFKCIWEKQIKNTLDSTRTFSAVERLFVHESQYNKRITESEINFGDEINLFTIQ